MKDVKELAKQDYLNGVKQKDISKKYNLSINTLQSWIKRYRWKEEKDGAKTKKKIKRNINAPPKKNSALNTRKNSTLISDKKPPIATTHGAYEKIMYSTMTEDEIELISDALRDNELEELYREKDILTVRELRYAKLIKQLRENETGLITVSAEKRKIETKHRGATPVDDYTEDTVETVGKTTYVFELIHKYEGELTRIQKQRAKVITDIAKIKNDREMIDIARQRLELEKLKVQTSETTEDRLEKLIDGIRGIMVDEE